MLVLGIDTGSHKCGYAVVVKDREQLTYVECGVLKAPANDNKWSRIHTIANDVRGILNEHHFGRGDMLAIEAAFVPRENFSGADTLAESRGAVVYVCVEAGVSSVVAVAPTAVKKSITGNGRADKEAVAEVLRKLFKFNVAPPPDAGDALGVAVAAARGAGK